MVNRPGRTPVTAPSGVTVPMVGSEERKSVISPEIGVPFVSRATTVRFFVRPKIGLPPIAHLAESPGGGWMESDASLGGAASVVTLMVAVSACVSPSAVSDATTWIALPAAIALTTPSGVTCTCPRSVDRKVGAGSPAIGFPAASRGVAVRVIVSYGATVDRLMRRWSRVRDQKSAPS